MWILYNPLEYTYTIGGLGQVSKKTKADSGHLDVVDIAQDVVLGYYYLVNSS